METGLSAASLSSCAAIPSSGFDLVCFVIALLPRVLWLTSLDIASWNTFYFHNSDAAKLTSYPLGSNTDILVHTSQRSREQLLQLTWCHLPKVPAKLSICQQDYLTGKITVWALPVKKVKLLLLLARSDLLRLINFTQIFLLSHCPAERAPLIVDEDFCWDKDKSPGGERVTKLQIPSQSPFLSVSINLWRIKLEINQN